MVGLLDAVTAAGDLCDLAGDGAREVRGKGGNEDRTGQDRTRKAHHGIGQDRTQQ